MSDKCHYIRVKGVGRVLIPECWAVVISGNIEDCTCNAPLSPLEEAQKEIERLKRENKRLKEKIKSLK